jgi:hypothetical protein
MLGKLAATATLNAKGELDGQWETDIGSAGTFFLFPHDPAQRVSAGGSIPDQLHTARHNFAAIGIDRDQFTALADGIQRDFTKGQVVVTVVSERSSLAFSRTSKASHLTQNARNS